MKYAIAIQHNGLVKKIPGTDNWVVSESFEWYIDWENKHGLITIEKGFETNFGSIPPLLRPIFNPTKYISYILHDKTWSKNAFIKYGDIDIPIDFKTSNEILREAMRVEGAGFIERWLVYIGLQYTCFPYFHFLSCKGD